MSGTHHDHTGSGADMALRTQALESLLVEKGLITTDVIDAVVRTYEQDVGPLNGAKVVARAWTDPAYKQRLLADGTAAVAELGFSGAQGADIVVLENTPSVHNVVVCTLCSCYPWPVLGLPPAWYKVLRLPFASGAGAENGAARVRARPAGKDRGARLGQQFRHPLHGAARTAGGHGATGRRRTHSLGYPRRDDRHCGRACRRCIVGAG